MTTIVTFVHPKNAVTVRGGSAGTGGGSHTYNEAGMTYNQIGVLYNGSPSGSHGVTFVAAKPSLTVTG